MVAPSLLFALQGGVVIDRYSRRRIGQIAELTVALAIVAMAVAESNGHLPGWAIYAVTAVLGMGTAITLPCYGAMLPQVLPRQRLIRGNAVWQIATQVGAISASGFGGLLVGAGSAGAGLWTAAGCCFASGAALQLVPGTPGAGSSGEAGFLRAMALAARTVSANRITLWVTVLSVLPPSTLAAANVLLPVFCHQRLGTGATGFGVVEAVWGVGAMVSGAAISRWSGLIRKELRVLIATLLLSGTTMVVFSLVSTFAGSVASAIALGFALSCSGVLFPAYVQANTPERVLGRVLSAIQFTSSAVQMVFYVCLWGWGGQVPSWTLFLALGLALTASAPILLFLVKAHATQGGVVAAQALKREMVTEHDR